MKEYVLNGYIICVGDGDGGAEIGNERYESILLAFQNKPQATGAMNYRLKNDLTWEPYNVGNMNDEEHSDLGDSEALEILLGGES